VICHKASPTSTTVARPFQMLEALDRWGEISEDDDYWAEDNDDEW
jgi:hypothetical protein